MAEALARAPLDLAQRLFGRGDALGDVVALRGEERQALLVLGEFFERHHVDRAEALDARAQLFEPCARGFEVEAFVRREARGDLLERLVQLAQARLTHEVQAR